MSQETAANFLKNTFRNFRYSHKCKYQVHASKVEDRTFQSCSNNNFDWCTIALLVIITAQPTRNEWHVLTVVVNRKFGSFALQDTRSSDILQNSVPGTCSLQLRFRLLVLSSICIWPRVLTHRQWKVYFLGNMQFPNRHDDLRGWHELRDVFTCPSPLNMCVSD